MRGPWKKRISRWGKLLFLLCKILKKYEMKKIMMILALVLMFGTVSAEEQKHEHARRRAKVAVVLSGGGAKGMAHIGVLRTLRVR